MNPTPSKLVHLWNTVQRALTESEEESKPTAEHENLIRGQYNQLPNNLTSVSEIAAHMYQDEKITAKDLEHIQQFHSTPIRASEELLNIIIRSSRDVYECFLDSLKKTNQHHVYQMLTTSVEQNNHSDEYLATEHSLVIQRNYTTLIDNIDVDAGHLMDHLYEAGLLTERVTATINAKPTKHEKSETLLALVSRFCLNNFNKFMQALKESSQEHVISILTGKDFKDAGSEHKLTTVKTKTESYASIPEKRIIPKTPPKPKNQLPVTFDEPNPLQIPMVKPTHPSRFESVAENHQLTTWHNVDKRQVFELEAQFKKLQNELQTEVSTKIALLCQKTSKDNIWKICFEKILEESHKKVQSQSQYQAIEEKCEKQRQEILEEKCKFIAFHNETQQEKTKTEKQISILQGKVYHLETSLKATVDDNEKLRKSIQESQLMVGNLTALYPQRKQKIAEREKIHSMQLNEKIEKLKLSDTEICMFHQLQEELESVREYVDLERKDHQERNEALRVELALAKQELGDQATHYEQKLKENESQLRETEKKFEETESRLRETEKKLEETETNLKLSLLETAEKLKATETKLKETEANPAETQTYIEECKAEDCTAKILDLEHEGEDERNSWVVEKKHLINQIQEQRRLFVGHQDKYTSDPVLLQIIRTKSGKKKEKSITGLTILGEELFVVSEANSEVEVYDSMTFNFSRRWNLRELINPNDIGSCNRNKCLYILDYKEFYEKSKEILRVEPNGNLINKWPTGDNMGHLSVTDESYVILTVYNKNKLNEYSPEGQLIREINLSSDAGIRHPWHAMKLTNGHFVVSYDVISYPADGVCVVDGDGNLKKSFGGSSEGQVRCPIYLAVDGNGFVMVIDYGNSRVLLLDSDLELKREIFSEENHGLQDPTRILLDETNNRLFVVDTGWNSKTHMYKDAGIFIFDFR